MWVTYPQLEDSMKVIKAWGFKYVQVGFVWDKQRVNPGFYTMTSIEIVIIGKRGKIPQPRGARNVRQFVSVKRTKHSEKPHEVRKRIEKMFPLQSKIELFARKKFQNWHVWGNEITNTINIEVKK